MPYLPIEQAVADLENRKRDRLPYVSDLPTQSLTTAGSTVSDASDINATLVLLTSVASGSGAKLPLAYAGSFVCIRNNGANTATIYCQTGETIDGTFTTTISASASKLFFAPSAQQWFTI